MKSVIWTTLKGSFQLLHFLIADVWLSWYLHINMHLNITNMIKYYLIMLEFGTYSEFIRSAPCKVF